MEEAELNMVHLEVVTKDYIGTFLVNRQLVGQSLGIGQKVQAIVGSRKFTFRVTGMDDIGSQSGSCRTGRVTRETVFNIVKRIPENPDPLPGYEQDACELASEINGYFVKMSQFQQLGVKPLQSILIYGLPGVGKTTVIRRALYTVSYPVAYGDLSKALVNASGTDCCSEYIEQWFDDLIDQVSSLGPCVIFVDRLDVLADAALASVQEEEASALVRHLVNFLFRLPDQVFIVIETNVKISEFPLAVRRCEALQHSRTIGPPRLARRGEIVRSIVDGLMKKSGGDSTSTDTVDIDELCYQVANASAGYVARDIRRLCKQSFLRALRSTKMDGSDISRVTRNMEGLSLVPRNPAVSSKQLCILPEWKDFAESFQVLRPSQQMEFEGVRPTKKWDEIGGYGEIKRTLRRFIRLAASETKSHLGIQPPSGVLLHGPSGCGKTALATAMISESGCNVVSIRGSELFSKYLGETEERLRRLFQAAREAAPCIVFMDEVDSIASKREWSSIESGSPSLRVLSTLLNEMDGVHDTRGVVAVGCTNQLDKIDGAILRPGRFDQLVEVDMPTAGDRVDILNTLSGRTPLAADVCMSKLASIIEGFSGANIEQMFREAGTAAMRRASNCQVEELSMDDLLGAIERVA